MDKILVIDDEPDIRLMLELFLRQAGYGVLAVETAQQALVAAEREPFSVVVSDIGMPSMDGYELAAALRQLPAFKTVPLIAVTGFVEYLERERAIEAGFDERLTKPIDLESLVKTIQRLQGKPHRRAT